MNVLQLALVLLAAAAPAAASTGGLTFEQAFAAGRKPTGVHFQATFRVAGAEHQLEVWRDGDRRVRRRTDDAVETFAFHRPGEAEFQLSVLDLKKRILTRVDRTSLYRIGSFTDWFDLSHGLEHPRGTYRLTGAGAPGGAPRPLERCRWYELAEAGRTTHICWSARDGIPVLVETDEGEVVWKVTRVDRGPVAPGTFDINDDGFVRNDAREDIEGD